MSITNARNINRSTPSIVSEQGEAEKYCRSTSFNVKLHLYSNISFRRNKCRNSLSLKHLKHTFKKNKNTDLETTAYFLLTNITCSLTSSISLSLDAPGFLSLTFQTKQTIVRFQHLYNNPTD